MPPIRFGSSWESFAHAPVAGMHALKGMGLSFIRLWVFWDKVNPKPDPDPETFNWTKVDADIRAIREAGLKVYANLLWAPPHASNGFPAYLTYTDGCTAWNDPTDGMKGIRFAKEKEFCTVPPHIDPMAVHRFGKALAERHGRDIEWYAAWNEPGQDIYWPAIRINWKPALVRLLDEVTIPFTEGVREVIPNARFVGPEADHEAIVGDVLDIEDERGLHLFDAITFHPYAWGEPFLDKSCARIDEGFVPRATPHRNGRELWYSEIGDDNTGLIVDWVEAVRSRDVAAINFHDFKQWFEPGTWDNGTYVPNAKYLAMQKAIRRRRRRPTHTPGVDDGDGPRLEIRRRKKPTKAQARSIGALHDQRVSALGLRTRY